MTVTVALLADMQDRQQIADALARFCSCVDDYDMAGLSDVFTQDCMTDYGPGRGGPVRGLSAVRARIARGQSEFVRTHHQLGQSTVTLRGDTASAVTYVTATHQHRIGSERSRAHLRYLDELVRPITVGESPPGSSTRTSSTGSRVCLGSGRPDTNRRPARKPRLVQSTEIATPALNS